MATPSSIADKIEDFFSSYPVRKFAKGQHLILSDEAPEFVFHLQKGQVREYDISSKGDETVVNVFKPPAFFPMSWAINGTHNQYFFQAVSDVSANTAPADAVVKFIKKNPDVMFDLLSRVFRGTDGLLRRMAHLMAGSARSRLIFELIIECRRFGKYKKDGSCVIDMSESEIGSRAGLSRETVSREIQQLKKLGLIIVSRQKIEVKSVDVLEKNLGSEL